MCPIFAGDITLADGLVNPVINIQSLQGSIIANNITGLVSISAPNLANISQSLELNILQSLNAVTFPLLTKVGTLSLVTLNSLNKLSFLTGVTEANNVIISDTSLTTLEGIDLTTVETFNINNNKFLTNLNFNLQSVSNILDFSSTGQMVQVTFPELIWANNMTIRDASLISLPNITTVNSTLSFTNNTIQSISCPNLGLVGGSLAIVSNSQLSNASFPLLQNIGGGFQIANNTALLSIDGFPNVNNIGGAIDFVGNFDNATLPTLQTVRGGVNVESSSDMFDCTPFNNAQKMNIIRGDSYQCKGPSVSTSVSLTPQATTGSRSGSGSSATRTASSSSSKGAAAAPVAYAEYSTFGALAALVFQFL